MKSGGIKVSPEATEAFRYISSIDVVTGGAAGDPKPGSLRKAAFEVDNRQAEFRNKTSFGGINANRFASAAQTASTKIEGDTARVQALVRAVESGNHEVLALALAQSFKVG